MRIQWQLVVLAVMIGLFALIVTIMLRPKTTQPSGTQGSVDQVTKSNDSGIINATNAALLRDSRLAFRDAVTGDFVVRSLDDGSEQRQQFAVEKIWKTEWEPNGQHILIRTSDVPPAWFVGTFSTGNLEQLHSETFSPTWNPTRSQLGYVFANRETNQFQFTVSEPEGTNWQTVFPLSREEGFREMSWSPLGTYLIAYDDSTTPSRYVRIFLSSKRIEALADTTDDLDSIVNPIRWSPSGRRALLAGKDEGVVNIAAVETGKVEPLGATSQVMLLAWESEDSLVGVVQDGAGTPHLSRITLKDKKATTLTDLADVSTINEVIGVYNKQLIVSRASTIELVPLTQ